MTSRLFMGIGLLFIAAGTIWTLQGLDYLKGSAMSGQTFWAVAGPILALLGVLMLLRGVRRSRT